MDVKEIENAAAWFEDRAKNTPMAGARKMFELAGVALREKANGVTVQEWISVSEPPKENGEYFCFCSTYKSIDRLTWYDGVWLLAHVMPVNNVTHWMPLPQPPKGE